MFSFLWSSILYNNILNKDQVDRGYGGTAGVGQVAQEDGRRQTPGRGHIFNATDLLCQLLWSPISRIALFLLYAPQRVLRCYLFLFFRINEA